MAFEYPLDGVGEGAPPQKTREWFSVAANNQPVTGTHICDQTYLNAKFGRDARPDSPRAWVQLEHAPADRGDPYVGQLGPSEEAWTLDAWTGHLWSPVVEVVLK